MKIQSLSVLVPNHRCINDCAFCVSKMHGDNCEDLIENNLAFTDLYVEEYIARLNYARDNGCNALMLTGNSEPQQNKAFLKTFGFMLRMMENPFRQIEMQTTGVMLDDPYLRFLRNWVNVNVISISLSSFDSEKNAEYVGMPATRKVDVPWLCKEIKRYNFTLRLSINLSDAYNGMTPEEIINKCKELGANQVTFRVLYSSGQDTPQDKWINQHNIDPELKSGLVEYITGVDKSTGKHRFKPLRTLEYGATAYSVNGMSVVIDTDCMAQDEKNEAIKYVILTPDCKLRSQWDDEASIIF